ncbi:TPA: hypothetical protein DDW35_02800, partial [Candidatus Sumerlaeota bacterium]|nr:hypothetical protein [Candidatus Sumerlaeota bacterium]
RTGVDLLGETGGILRPANKWSLSSRISIPIGYEMTATAVQITAAMAAIANNGQYVKPHVLKEIRSPSKELIRKAEPELGARVCSPQTSKTLLDMMEQVVVHGTGKEAAVPGFRVGGKTGTTRKDKKSDSDERLYYASFIGVVPIESPRLVIYTWVDEPKNEKYGGTVAAPIFRMVAEHATRVLNIQPTQPINTGKASVVEDDDDEVIDNVVTDSLPSGPIVPREMGDGDVLMPNLVGKTMKEVVDELGRLKVECDIVGTGAVVQQQPEANISLPKGDHAVVILGERPQD